MRQSETLRTSRRVQAGVMMRIGTAALLATLAGIVLLPGAGAGAQTTPQGIRLAQATPAPEASVPRRRPATRLRVFPRDEPDGVIPRYYPGRNAVRECTATYVQEYRPSGTVIVPRTSCHWRPGYPGEG
jgi:hypothetical protein